MRAAVLVVVALAVRAIPVLSGGGLLLVGRYDDGVYYAAAASLADGRMPYRDFVLLHPPLIAVALAPFALLGRLTTDPIGLATARVTWMLLGAVATLVVARIAERRGRRAGWVAGLLYACSSAVAQPDQVTYIEPLGDLLVLLALMLLLEADTVPRRWWRAAPVVGALLGLSLAAKIWYVVPVGIVLGWLVVTRRWSLTLRVALGVVVAATIAMGPFLLAAPRQMWHMVVVDQLTRLHGSHIPISDRLGYVGGIQGLGLPADVATTITTVLMVAWVLALVALVLRGGAAGRLLAVLALGELAVLLRVPVFIAHYGHFAAGAFVLVLVLGWVELAGWAHERIRPRWGSGEGEARATAGPAGAVRTVGTAAVVALALTGAVAFAAHPTGRRLPVAQIRDVLPPGCVAADDPTALAIIDRLSSDLQAGCPVAVDVTGDSYGSPVYRTVNRAYQHRLLSYLRSGSVAIVRRHKADGLIGRQVRGVGETVLKTPHLRVLVPARRGPGGLRASR